MKKLFLLLLLAPGLAFSQATGAEQVRRVTNETPEQKAKRMEWWTEARFGMFIHWGLYSVPGRHEWIQLNEMIQTDDYAKYLEAFDPDLYNAREWAAYAKKAGFKYVVLTAKHHEGFCMWDSKYTDYKVTNTPAGRDLVKEFVDAFRAEGIKVGFYFSMIDWHHPEYIVDGLHPLRKTKDEANAGRDMEKYRQYMRSQLTELLTKYGEISTLFFDFSHNEKGKDEWDAESLYKICRKYQPGIVINDRLDLMEEGGWDYATPEQFMPNQWPTYNGERVPWETCQTFSGSWGYYRDEQTWKSVPQLVGMLIETVSKGGNLLLNVGPTARGAFDDRAVDRLEGIGEWMRFNSRAIYGCTEAPDSIACPNNCLLTYNPKTNRLYVHVLFWPVQTLTLKGLGGDRVKYVQFLHDGSEIRSVKKVGYWGAEEASSDDLQLSLPVQKPNVEIPVIEVFLN